MRAAAVAVLAAVTAMRLPADAATPLREPAIVEFGPSFRSAMCGIVVRDDAIWIEQSDGVARMTRDGKIVHIRRADDARYFGCEAATAGTFARGNAPRVCRSLVPTGSFSIGSFGETESLLAAAGTSVIVSNGFSDARSHALQVSPTGASQAIALDGCLVSESNLACFPGRSRTGVLLDYWAKPTSVVRGPDGNLWFTDVIHSAIGRVTRDGTVTYFTRGLTRWHSGPHYLTIGPDGAMNSCA